MKMHVYSYRPDLIITNLDALPSGTGCKFLECIYTPDGKTLVAKQWRKGRPYGYEALVLIIHLWITQN